MATFVGTLSALASAARAVDWVTAIATAVAAFATVAAVLVALFGSELRARRRRPVVQVRGEEMGFEVSPRGGYVGEYQLEVGNAAGRDTAHVEILLTVSDDAGVLAGDGPIMVDSLPLTWQSGLLGHYGADSSDVPPGVTRRSYLLYVGSRRAIFARHWPAPGSPEPPQADAIGAAFAVYPARSDKIRWLDVGGCYTVRLDVVLGDAGTFALRGRLRVELEPRSQDDDPECNDDVMLSVRWVEPLRALTAKQRTAATWRRAWAWAKRRRTRKFRRARSA